MDAPKIDNAPLAGFDWGARSANIVAALPVITVPTVTLDGEANAIIPASDGRSSAAKFSGSESTIGCRMRATPYRSKRRKSSPSQSWK